MDHGRCRPAQQRGNDQAHALAGARRREGYHMLRSFVAQVAAVFGRHPAEEDTGRFGQPGFDDLLALSPTRRSVGRDALGQPGAPHSQADRGACGEQAARSRDSATTQKDVWGIRIVEIPPLEELPRLVDRYAIQAEPRRPELRLMPERRCRPLRRSPDASQGRRQHYDDLPEQDPCRHQFRLHVEVPVHACRWAPLA
jgi:hypothetical protein